MTIFEVMNNGPFYLSSGTLVKVGSILKIKDAGYFEVISVSPSVKTKNFYVGAAGIGKDDNRSFDRIELEDLIFDDVLRIYNAS